MIELHQELRELYSITPDAPRIADCLLSKDFPKACRLRLELEVLKQRLLVEDDENRRPHLAKRSRNRPEILAPFVERFAFSRRVSFKNRFRLAVLSHKSGDHSAAFAILDFLKPKEIVARLKGGECSDCNGFHQLGKYMEVFDLLNDYNPTLSLRILRSTRARDVKQDHEERVSSRRAALAKTHRRLGRDQLAQKLAQQA